MKKFSSINENDNYKFYKAEVKLEIICKAQSVGDAGHIIDNQVDVVKGISNYELINLDVVDEDSINADIIKQVSLVEAKTYSDKWNFVIFKNGNLDSSTTDEQIAIKYCNENMATYLKIKAI